MRAENKTQDETRKNETPNEVNTWKPSTKKKDKGEPQADAKPPKSPETNKPEENPNKPKDNSKGTEGTGKDSVISKHVETVSYDKVYPTRQLDVDGDRYIIDKVIEYKSKLSKTLLKKMETLHLLT